MDLSKIETGDLLLFGTNRGSGFIVRLGTSSDYNHIGIAIWVKDKQITLNEGELHIFEMSKPKRFDVLLGKEINGAGLTSINVGLRRYNLVSLRKLKSELRPKDLLSLTTKCIEIFHQNEFNEHTLAFVSAWLNVDLLNKHNHFPRFICSELVVQYYTFVYNHIYREGQYHLLFGPEVPWLISSYTPQTFTPSGSPNNLIFTNELITIKNESSLSSSFWPAFILGLVVILIICFLLWLIPKRFNSYGNQIASFQVLS